MCGTETVANCATCVTGDDVDTCAVCDRTLLLASATSCVACPTNGTCDGSAVVSKKY